MTAWYDYHIREIGDLILRAHSVNEDGTKTLLNNLEAMTTQVMTQFGLSKEGYKSTEEEIHYGTGQGNIVSVFVCQFGTSCIFYLLDEKYQGWQVHDEKGKVVGVKLAVGFVDHTDYFIRRKHGALEVVGDVYQKYIQLY